MIQSLLIANRGEIACRIIRTARAMGIRTVAVYSDADAKALHVRQADEAVHIGPSPARESYLVGETIIAAALSTGAEAIHPGYGFLSENAEFAQAVIDAGLIWVGPRPASITAMGLKDAAKTLMTAAGVPVTPGYMGENQDPAFLGQQAAEIGYPVLIKAVAGGGGKGMRKVEDAADFADALASCQREATASFGNAHVLIEKYIQRPRHIEVQVFGDTHGNIVHLFERDCSLQRRHQKVIEEAPAPGMDEATREQLCAAAVKAAKAVDYIGAGTIEFIADASEGLRADRIWFMEMNTRLQVEHPVTEEITGVDLVEWQLWVAAGGKLPLTQNQIKIDGWAMEARIYAEDPSKGFLPSIGPLEVLEFPGQIRVETGVEQGDTITCFYDPMIAKFVARGDDRRSAIASLKWGLSVTRIHPVNTNTGYLHRILDNEKFSDHTQLHTGFLADNDAELQRSDVQLQTLMDDAAAALLGMEATDWRTGFVTVRDSFRFTPPGNVWRDRFGFRLNADDNLKLAMRVEGQTCHRQQSDNYWDRRLWVLEVADGIAAFNNGEALHAGLRWDGAGSSHAHDGDILSPMPGRIIAVEVTQGQTVTKDQKLLTLEAMKMEHSLTAPFDGVVAELNATAGAQVQVEVLLARIEPVNTA
jgi:3-methylcrotonyl-CoA carboxylase alpha subunit